MDFEKKYHLTQFPGETLQVMWTRGYRSIEVYYQGKLLLKHENSGNLQKGVSYSTTELGTIVLKLSEKPVVLDVIVDGYHCVNNVSHPAKQLKGASAYFWIIAVFAVIASVIEGIYLGDSLTIGTITTIINGITVTLYFIAAVFTGKSRPWAFYLGFSVFCFWTLLGLLTVFSGSIVFLIAYIVRLVILYFLITNIKYAVGVTKHRKFVDGKGIYNEGLLDGKI